ncbi:PREDICTED: cation channel sperm-associated protein subunit gamma [Ceratotherium simum simum]|uniref:Cation channel sperm-associated protein subunit gamma n=1 Tax=Ceratotherium simum simum TaxID=73337 RepID=A0ABM1DID6_CERSS|nr:PREDICTED: cation channel sperm-associated protein subunit gamma [Ceratotherium simum simum]
MSLPGPAWPRLRVLRALWALLAVPWAPWRLWAIEDIQECTWQVVLNQFATVGKNRESDRFFDQEPLDTVGSVFSLLVDAPIDPDEKYLGFPYYLKINYSCKGESSEALVRKGHLTGLKPVVLVTFQSPVNFRHWKIEQLQIQMEAAPFRSTEPCSAEVCVMSWYTPMPIKNGSVVMHVDVSSNGLGPFIPDKRFQVNINGFLQRQRGNVPQFTMGNELLDLVPRYFVNAPSRPLWYTVDQAPVLILGGIPGEKSILLSDTSFKDFFLVELSIDSCWVGSFYCPQAGFTATIYDAIATESTLFIRQNQLVYYFTGTYVTLHESNHGSGSWVRVLATECIKKLCPVHFHSNGSEYIMALTTGKHEGYVHFGTITDGRVSFEMLPRQQSVCEGIQVVNCSITWATYTADDSSLLLLVEIEEPAIRKYFQVVRYDLVSDYLAILYTIPEFIPDAGGLEFLMILGTESYTNFPMVPKGMVYNPYNKLLFIWGNFLLQSYDKENFIYLADFPKELSIKYLVSSFRGDVAVVTETEEIWYLLDGGYRVYKLFPSEGWQVHVSLQAMHQSSLHAPNETMVTLFYEDNKLYQLVYLINNQQGQLVKRLVPVEQLLMYQQLSKRYLVQRQGSHPTLSFTNLCPFTVMRLRDLPNPQIYTRQERYRARPPRVLEPSGFHSENSLAVYQGLVYYLLWLHSKYDKPYADPVHDPTWRWWKNNKQDQDYFSYLASSWQSAGHVHIDMDSYEKIYDLQAEHELPERIFLDKGTSYRFSVFLTARGHSFKSEPEQGFLFKLQSQLGLGVVLANPDCIEAVVKQKVLVNRNSVLFWVTLSDKRVCFEQGISGHHLLTTSMLLKVVGSAGHCFQNTHQGPRMQGNLLVPVLIGCPPGKRLAFDITYTLQYNRLQNKHYFDCVHVDPEMPCFLFRDVFYPFFLIQDLVTGESGSFQGSYVLKVVGGGPTLDSIKEYSEEDIYRFNSPLDRTDSLIWTTKNRTTTKDSAFNIMSHQSLGIEWLCLENSPCHDTVPHSIFAPEFFFKVLVSNRGVDKSTYCDHQLTFLLHIHGLPLSAKRALFILMVSASLFVGLVLLYIAFCLLLPLMVKACNVLRWKINNIIASESYSTYVTSSRVFSSPSRTKARAGSRVGSRVSSRAVSRVAEENAAEPEETSRRRSLA